MASVIDEQIAEDEFIEDEVWENQRREGGMWLPAWDRGRFADRFGRYKYNQVFDVPIPNNSRVVEDFTVATTWMYAKNFGTLESDLAKGFSRTEKWNHNVRWRKWVRKRLSPRETPAEVLAGWLGSRERRGTWKSRYFMLIGGGSAAAANFTSAGGTANCGNGGGTGDDSEDDSSNDEGDDDDVVEEEPPKQHPSQPGRETETDDQGNSSAMAITGVPPSPAALTRQLSDPEHSQLHQHQQPAVLLYLRRSFTDPRAAFPLTFDVSEMRNFPKKQVRTIKLSGRVRIDESLATSEFPGRFAIRFPSGRKRVLNAANAEQRERWVEALRTVIEESGCGDVTLSPTSGKRQGRFAAAFRAAKRGQQELRKGFGTLRRSSQGNSHHQMILSANHPHMLPSPALNASGRSQALSVDQGFSLSPGPLLSSPITTVIELLRSEPTGAINIRLTEPVAGKGLFVESVLDTARDVSGNFPSSIAVGDNIVAIQGESLMGLDKGMAMVKLKEILSRPPRTDRVALSVVSVNGSSQRALKKTYSPPSPQVAAAGSSSIAKRERHSPRHNPSAAARFGLEATDDSEREDYDSKPGMLTPVHSATNVSQHQTSPSSPSLGSSPPNAAWAFKSQASALSGSGSLSSTGSGVGTTSGYPPLPSKPLARATSSASTSTRQKMTDVPVNGYGIVSSHARSMTIKCLEKMTAPSLIVGGAGPQPTMVTYAQLRQEVAKTLHVDTAFETDEWRLWFRDFLDYWVCDGNKYSVGGLDLNDFTPVIIRHGTVATISDAVEGVGS